MADKTSTATWSRNSYINCDNATKTAVLYYLLLHSEEVSYLHSVHINVWKPNLDREITSLTSSLCVGFKWQMTVQQCRTFQVNNKEHFLRQVVFYQACFSCLFVWVQRLEVARRKKNNTWGFLSQSKSIVSIWQFFQITILKLLPYCHIHFRSNKYLYLFIIGWSLDVPMLGLECIKWIYCRDEENLKPRFWFLASMRLFWMLEEFGLVYINTCKLQLQT